MNGLVYAVVCLLLNAFVLGLDKLNIGDNCTDPDGESGKCIRLADCSIYRDILKKFPDKNIPDNVLNIFRRAKCGASNGKALVCCPNIGIMNEKIEEPLDDGCQTPFGKKGKCVAKSECSTLSVNLHILEQSRCGQGSSEGKYCCESKEDKIKSPPRVGILDRSSCGPVSNALPVNGRKSAPSPWVALIAYTGETEQAVSYRCTGSLVNKRYVLSAAHCFKYLRGKVKPVSVRLGEHNLEAPIDCTEEECLPSPQDVAIDGIIIHPQYKGRPNYEHDIALLKLAKDVNLNTQYVKPVCLPAGLTHETKDVVGEDLLVSGWCSYENKEIPVPLKKILKGLSHEECSSKLDKEIPISSDKQLCTTSENNSNCEGFGGSPLVKYETGPEKTVAIQYGIASFGPKHCSHSEIPSIFTRISQYSEWIQENMT